MIAAAHELEMKQISARRECRVSYLKSILPGMSLPDRGIGLQNLGASCFINAGIQSLLAIPQLPSWIEFGVSPVEEAFKNVLNMMASDASSITPQPLTDIFYRGQQADAAEFVLGLLETCPSIQASLQGIECPRFQCQHCSYSRPLREDKFLSLQLPLMVAGPMSSVQEALNSYMNAEHVQEGAEEWFCCNEECLTTGRAVDAPMHQTRIVKWPNVLVICLKRWDGTHGLLSHRVYCNETLTADGHAYRLASLITHIGASPTSGHYVAYRRAQHEFLRLDDARATPFDGSGGFFSPMQNEKVYILIYMKEESARSTRHVDPRHPDDSNRRPPTKRAAIELDSDPELPPSNNPNDPEADADSDVILSHGEAMEPEAVTNSMGIDGDLRLDIDSDVILAEEEKTFANGNTNNDQNPNPDAATSKAIIDLCTDSNKDDRTKRKVIDLDIDSNEDDKDPSLLQQNPIEAHISGGESPPRNTRRSQSPGAASNADAQGSQHGQAESKKGLASYTHEERQLIADALRTSASVAEAGKRIAHAVAKFTMRDSNSSTYLSKSTLRNWHRNHDCLKKAMDKAGKATPETPTKARASRPGTTRHNLSEDDKQKIAAALEQAKSVPDLVKILAERLPGFSCTDTAATTYIPRSTLHNWITRDSTPDWFMSKIVSQTWEQEYEHSYAVAIQKPQKRKASDILSTDAEGLWLQDGSWSFCPQCGRRRPRSRVEPSWTFTSPAILCSPTCDPHPVELLSPPQRPPVKDAGIQAYVTPVADIWYSWSECIASKQLPLTSLLSDKELASLAVVDIHVDYRSRRGGSAEVLSKQKRSVVRCRWRADPLMELPRSDRAAKAFTWLLENNITYKNYVIQQTSLAKEQHDAADWRNIPTATLLLSSPAIEIAARPWLYPLPSFADSDLSERLHQLGWLKANSKPSMRASFARKLGSRCLDYSRDFPLQCLLYDMCMARTISSVVSIAHQKQVSPEQISSDMDMFEGYWTQQLHKMEDICRQEWERAEAMEQALPSIFFTIAPAEWRYGLHAGVFTEDSLTNQQNVMTLHLYHSILALLDLHLLKDKKSLNRIGIAKIRQWSLRFEFQARGTLHLHAVLWADLLPDRAPNDITGRTDTAHCSQFVKLLEELFRCRVDVQCGDGHYNLLKYVAGYVTKASDAMKIFSKQSTNQDDPAEKSRWRQIYRLLCKKSPMEQEIAMEFAGLPMTKHSFTGVALFAPIPGSSASNSSTAHYAAYQQYLKCPAGVVGHAKGLSYMQWLRQFRLVDTKGPTYPVTRRNVAGPGASKSCGIAMAFPFELLDIYVGAWAAAFLVNMDEARLQPSNQSKKPGYPEGFENEQIRRHSFEAPEGCRHLKAVLCLDEFQLPSSDPRIFSPDVGKLLAAAETELIFRGIGADRIATFKARLHACTLLLLKVRDGQEDPQLWSARRISSPPQRQWSPQQLEVLTRIQEGTRIADASAMTSATRLLQVRGGPGTGKTEVVIAAAAKALEDGCRVLIAGPIGLLVSMYRMRLPSTPDLTMETIHSAFRIVRDADAAYIPPGRLRAYDLIIFDEVSQIDATTWLKLKVALSELCPCPFIVFVGDFQQLQPVSGPPILLQDLTREVQLGTVALVELQHHEAARSVDASMLDFLETARVRQPSRPMLEAFFQDRIWKARPCEAAAAARRLELAQGETFTFLTVTNKGAADLNLARLALEFPTEASIIAAGGGIPADTGTVALSVGMRLRLTHNIDKDRGFVNGNTGAIRTMLRRDVCVLQTEQGLSVLVHPITFGGRKFMPVAYGYATTMRRAQGSTLNKIGLRFDRRLSDRGYAYVGVSRAKKRRDVFLLGSIRRTDWRPVGGDSDPNEQNELSALSESSGTDRDSSSSTSDQEPGSSDFESNEEPNSSDFAYASSNTSAASATQD